MWRSTPRLVGLMLFLGTAAAVRRPVPWFSEQGSLSSDLGVYLLLPSPGRGDRRYDPMGDLHLRGT